MKLASIILPGLLVLAGCTTQPEAPKPPKIGLANPASVYCEQKGGKLPGGEVIDEWALWRREHPTTGK